MQPRKAAIIGGGVIGGGWLARLIENGIACSVFDPDPEAARKLGAVLEGAERAYAGLTDAPRPRKAAWSLAGSVAEAAAGADLIVEAVPERLDVKRAVYAEIETVNAEGVIASSTSGIMPSDLQAEMAHPGRLIVAHPFNPVYLLPLVELVAGKATEPSWIDWAKGFYPGIGMHPLHCRVEIEGFLSDRLQEALWREALWLLHDEVATAEELDAAIAYGPGLRWAQMGTMQTFHLAGGEAGMRGMLAMFGPCLKWPWTKLMDVPDLTDAFVDRVGDQCEDQAAGLGPRDLERIRDDNLVAIMQALKANGWGAGKTLAGYEAHLRDRASEEARSDPVAPIQTIAGAGPDGSAHDGMPLTDERCVAVFAEATDALTDLIGAGADYVASGRCYVTTETDIRRMGAGRALEPITVDTQVLDVGANTVRLLHRMHDRDGQALAIGEYKLVHVSLESKSASAPGAEVSARLAEIAARHVGLSGADGTGRGIGA